VITDLFLWLLGYLLRFIAWLMPDLPNPAESIGQASSAWRQLAAYMAGAAGWFPFTLALTCVGVIAVIAAAAGAVKLVRMVASFVTCGGSSAA
jgi:hypothetical protein